MLMIDQLSLIDLSCELPSIYAIDFLIGQYLILLIV